MEKHRLTESFIITGKIDKVSSVDTRLIKNHILSNFSSEIEDDHDFQNKKEFSRVKDLNVKDEMTKEFINYYGKNILNKSTLINGVKKFLIWCNKENISMAVCTNKTEHLAVDLLKKIGIYNFFEYVAGHNTFDYCKPDPRHLTSIVEILDGDLNKTLMIGDSETDANAAKNAGIPLILLEDGYTEKNTNEIYHNHLVKDFVGIENIVLKYF